MTTLVMINVMEYRMCSDHAYPKYFIWKLQQQQPYVYYIFLELINVPCIHSFLNYHLLFLIYCALTKNQNQNIVKFPKHFKFISKLKFLLLLSIVNKIGSETFFSSHQNHSVWIKCTLQGQITIVRKRIEIFGMIIDIL